MFLRDGDHVDDRGVAGAAGAAVPPFAVSEPMVARPRALMRIGSGVAADLVLRGAAAGLDVADADVAAADGDAARRPPQEAGTAGAARRPRGTLDRIETLPAAETMPTAPPPAPPGREAGPPMYGRTSTSALTLTPRAP